MKLDIVAEAGNDSFDFTTTNAVADKKVVTSAKVKMAEMRYRPSSIVISRWMRALRKGIFPSCHIATHGVRSAASVVFAVFIRKILFSNIVLRAKLCRINKCKTTYLSAPMSTGKRLASMVSNSPMNKLRYKVGIDCFSGYVNLYKIIDLEILGRSMRKEGRKGCLLVTSQKVMTNSIKPPV